MKRFLAVLSVLLLGAFAAVASDYAPVTLENFDRTVVFKEKPKSVAVLTLNAAEILSALGETDAITAIARNGNLVEDVLPNFRAALEDRAFPDVINKGLPTLEGMLGLGVDTVICNSYYFRVPQIFGTMEDYAANGITFYINEGSYVDKCTIENTYNDIRNIGAIFSVPERADKLIDAMKTRFAAVADKIKGLEPKSVMSFDSLTEDSFCVAGGSGLVQNLIEMAGGKNAFGDLDAQFPKVNLEEIIIRAPDVIVVHAYTADDVRDGQNKIEQLKKIRELSEIPAIKNNNFIVVPVFEVFPGLQNADYVEMLAAALHPEAFK